LEESVVTINEIIAAIEAAVGSGERPLILIHGGPLNDPSSVETALQQTGADGYVTGSTGERIPVEQSVAAAIASFKRLPKGAMK
jgi:predicted TIM-barrel enzyme